MKKLLFIAFAFIALTALAVVRSWTNDDNHSSLGFTVTHLGINEVDGTFSDFDVSVQSAKPDFSDAVFQLTAKVNSIDTRVEARDKDLRSDKYFGVQKYPTITFKSNSIKPAGQNKYKLGGDLTMHGVTKPITVDLTYKGSVENPMTKKQTAVFKVAGSLNRKDFGIAENVPSLMVSDEIQIHAAGEFDQTPDRGM